MATRRMFSNRIANSAKFLQMPTDSQLLYFHMVLRADDDGVVESYSVMKLLGIASDAFRVLVAKEFVRILNEDQVIVITDWTEHNTIRADRKVNSIYQSLLTEKYPDMKVIEPKPRSDVEDNSKRLSGPSTDGIGKVRLGKSKKTVVSPELIEWFEKIWLLYPKKIAKKDAIKAITKLNPDEPLRLVIENSISIHKKTEAWLKKSGTFIPYMASWINAERYRDEVEVLSDYNKPETAVIEN